MQHDKYGADPHPEWSHPFGGWRRRVRWRFVLVSWLIALAITLIVTIPAGWAIIALQGDVTVINAELVMIVAAFVTFLVYFAVMFTRLRSLDHDRLLNSMSVALVHTAVSLSLVVAASVLRSSYDANSVVPGNRFEGLGLIFFSLDRTAAAAIVACGLAAAIMPARGPLPTGTQTDALPSDRQL